MHSFTNLTDLLPNVAGKCGLSQNLESSHVLLAFDRYVSELFQHPDVLARAGFVKNNILFCYTRSAVVSQELMYKKRQILAHLERATGQKLDNLISKVRASACTP